MTDRLGTPVSPLPPSPDEESDKRSDNCAPLKTDPKVVRVSSFPQNATPFDLAPPLVKVP
jgi:hypothetical protein